MFFYYWNKLRSIDIYFSLELIFLIKKDKYVERIDIQILKTDLVPQDCIDTLKETVPIWKKEFFEDGEVWVAAHP